MSTKPTPTSLFAGQQIRTRRDELDLSSSELARRLGITLRRLTDLEAGIGPIPMNLLYRLCEHLRVTPNYFSEDFCHIDALSLPLSLLDAHVGSRLRLGREAVGLTLIDLAHELDLTPGKLMAFEEGTERVSASMLYVFSQRLNIPVAWVFEGFSQGDGS